MKRTGPKTEPWGTPQVRSEGEDFIPCTVPTCYYLCPILQVGMEEGQGKITNVNVIFQVVYNAVVVIQCVYMCLRNPLVS